MKQLIEPHFVFVIGILVSLTGIVFGEPLPASFAFMTSIGYVAMVTWISRSIDIEKETLEKRLKTLELKMENVETKLNFR